MEISTGALRALVSSDFEFKRETRYLNGVLKLGIGPRTLGFVFDDGILKQIDEPAPSDAECKIVVKGTADQWTELLQERPRPFYQCIQSAAVKHGLQLSDSNETFAYLPALNRLTTLLRRAKGRTA